MDMENADLSHFEWLNPPEQFAVTAEGIELSTLPETDFWQRTHSGQRRNSGHAFLTRLWDDFSFSACAEYAYETLYDQCGLMLYLDADNWAKLSFEYENEAFGQLGSVVTGGGYSDWASTPMPTDYTRMFFRISRRGSDFRFDYSQNGNAFTRQRVFHMPGDLATARIGVYACSPFASSFTARFSQIRVGASVWTD